MVYRNRPLVLATDWTPLALAAGWSGTARYRIIGGVLYLRGSITRTSGSSNTVLTLPPGARLAEGVRVVARNGSGVIPVAITSGGVVVTLGYSAANPLDLESIPPQPLG